MNIKDRASSYIGQGKTMQIATSVGDKPWICTVYYVADQDMNLYWLSFPDRRHSQDLLKNNKAAIAIQIKADIPVVGLQAEGVVEAIDSTDIIKDIMGKYVEKYGTGKSFYHRFLSGKNNHRMYKLKPDHLYIFDEINYPGGKRQKVI